MTGLAKLRLAFLVSAILAFIAPSRASAQDGFPVGNSGNNIGVCSGAACTALAVAGIAGLGAASVLVLGGPVWNTVALAKGERSPLWLRITSSLIGAGATTLGVMTLGSASPPESGTLFGLGLLNVGLSAWASSLPEAESGKPSMSIGISPTAPGAFGFSVRLRL
jgi:hypothetical protein